MADESHFIFSDSSFMNKTNLVFSEIIQNTFPNSILIYISATLDELLPHIEEEFKNNIKWDISAPKIYKYCTGIDYSYLDVKYFKSNKVIVNSIVNDKSNDKWLIFVTSGDAGKKMQQELESFGIDSIFIKSGVVNDETKSILDNEKFNCKVLISTKVLDNGVNIKDVEVANLVVCAYDKTTFIQEIGRLRVNIKNPRKVNLFIKMMGKKTFNNILKYTLEPKLKEVELFEKDIDKFKAKYNLDVNFVFGDLFFLNKDNEWQLNKTGKIRLLKDYEFATKMISLLICNKFAYIQEQLSWLNKVDEFDEDKLIDNHIRTLTYKDAQEDYALERYLSSRENDVMLQRKDRTELIEKINAKSNGRLLKSLESMNDALQERNINYKIIEFETSRIVKNKKKKFKDAWRIIKLVN